MFDEEFEYDEVTSFLSSIEDFSKVRKQRREVKDEEERSEVRKSYYKHRRFEERPPYAMSCWGRMLVNPRTKDPSDAKGGKLFRLRFRVPFPLFQRLVDTTRANSWFSEKKDCTGRLAAPLELKILGVLRVLGRGYCFDGMKN
jgi:hypothetical protein